MEFFNNSPRLVLYVTSEGGKDTPYRHECKKRQVTRFLNKQKNVVAWAIIDRARRGFNENYSDNWYSGGNHLWFGEYSNSPLPKKRNPLDETPCVLLVLNLRTGETQFEYTTGTDYTRFLDEDNREVAWGNYKIIYSSSTHLNKISMLTLLAHNVLWERHYIDRFGYVDSGE